MKRRSTVIKVRKKENVFHDMALTLAVVCCHFAERAMEVVETSVLSIV
jgi:VanZ family protein